MVKIAHFAEIDENNIVTRVLVVANENEHRGQELVVLGYKPVTILTLEKIMQGLGITTTQPMTGSMHHNHSHLGH